MRYFGSHDRYLSLPTGRSTSPLAYAELPIESLASRGDSIVYLLAEFEPLTIA